MGEPAEGHAKENRRGETRSVVCVRGIAPQRTSVRLQTSIEKPSELPVDSSGWMWGILSTEGLAAVDTSLLHILFIVNTVKTISAVTAHKERKESIPLLLRSLHPETGALTQITHDCNHAM